MPDITYESLMAAKTAKADTSQEFDIMKMANLALNILEQVNRIKGGGGDNVMTSRPVAEQSTQTSPKQIMDVDQILGTLKTVKSIKGDIKLSELEKLVKEHKDQIEIMLKAI